MRINLAPSKNSEFENLEMHLIYDTDAERLF